MCLHAALMLFSKLHFIKTRPGDLVKLNPFGRFFGLFWTIMDQFGYIWTNMCSLSCLFGPVYLDLSLLTRLFVPVSFDADIWTHKLGYFFKTCLFGHVYQNLYISTHFFVSIFLDLSDKQGPRKVKLSSSQILISRFILS